MNRVRCKSLAPSCEVHSNLFHNHATTKLQHIPEKDLTALKKLNPELAGELAEFLKSGKEEIEYAHDLARAEELTSFRKMPADL